MRKFVEQKNIQDDFFIFIYLDNSFFDEFRILAINEKYFKKNDDKKYNFQVKLFLYTTFNKYLNVLSSDFTGEKMLEFCNQLKNKNGLGEVFKVLSEFLEDNEENIINNFFNYLKEN